MFLKKLTPLFGLILLASTSIAFASDMTFDQARVEWNIAQAEVAKMKDTDKANRAAKYLKDKGLEKIVTQLNTDGLTTAAALAKLTEKGYFLDGSALEIAKILKAPSMVIQILSKKAGNYDFTKRRSPLLSGNNRMTSLFREPTDNYTKAANELDDMISADARVVPSATPVIRPREPVGDSTVVTPIINPSDMSPNIPTPRLQSPVASSSRDMVAGGLTAGGTLAGAGALVALLGLAAKPSGRTYLRNLWRRRNKEFREKIAGLKGKEKLEMTQYDSTMRKIGLAGLASGAALGTGKILRRKAAAA